ncbi:AIP3-domain-containing protein [Meira miltonrushii]|uniref:AIP3-domain-containing protein n=1 Tax=Meira miltonrushii TaxID=1280837 RepID=A0A316VK03_9BASI|nr:AIP3-domain-containing protein [Meira miltonrushii]PWN37939.1 AIP3-domain-containing protein [Meira miltonrushii]
MQQTRYSSSHMESSVTRLLVATKMLLEALTKWSLGQRTESQVSDIYVRLGNDFNVANVAFGSYGIDMSDLTSVPDDLRDCLERCLSEDASPQTLEIHLPRIREIIIGLLQGLKSKQAEYKQLVMQRRASARSSKTKTERGAIVDSSTITSAIPESSRLSGANGGDVMPRDGMGRSSTGAGASVFGDDVRKSITGKRPINAPPITEEAASSIQRPTSASSSRQSDQVRPPHRRNPSVRALKSRDALERRASKRFSAYTFNKMGVGLNQANHRNVSGSRTPTASSWNAKQANSMALFLQLGRQTKKVNVDLDPTAPFKGLSTGKLRMLFMDKFSYSPGKEDFPTIYVKDAHSGVTYELEDLSELTDGTVLTLNIEPLDQVKQHLDLTLGSITRELRDLKTAMQDRDREWSRRISAHPHDGLSPQISMAPRISDAQFAKAGARVAQYKRATMPKSVAWQMAGDQLKKQYDEVLNVRRQLAVMAQIQDDFKSDVGGLLGTLREQAKRVRTIAAMEVPTERNFIITGKARLDSNSQEVLTLVEDLLDLVDDLKSDVIQRGVKPKPHAMKKLSEDIDRATRGLEELSKYVDLVKPSWKKTWEMELQNIVDEQEFLNHQEGLIADLKEDHANLQDVFHNIQEVVKLRGANKFNLLGSGANSENALSNISLRTYIPPPPEEGHEGLSTVMMEVKSQRPDHEKRLKALEAAEKQRLKENHQRKTQEDEFQSELTTFVDGKALRKTGGYMETERIRGKRDKMTLNAMFGAGGVGGAPISDTVKAPPRKLVVGGKSSGGTSDNGSKEALTPTAGYSSNGSYSGELLGEASTPPETFSDEVSEN